MKYLNLFGINGVTQRQSNFLWKMCTSFLISLLVTGCASTIASYKVDQIEKPQMSFSEAIRTFHSFNKRHGRAGMIEGERLVVLGNIYFPLSGTADEGGWQYIFRDIKQLDLIKYGSISYLTYEGSIAGGGLCLKTPDDAKRFADTFMALKYYMSNRFVTDDAVALDNFREQAKQWRALSSKPVMPEVKQQSEYIDENAEFYEHTLAVEPLWPRAQFMVAVWEGEWGWYGMAGAHMKRYLELVPDARDAEFARKMVYVWDEMVKADKQGRAKLDQQMWTELKRQEETVFREKAMAWRALPVKPALTEDVQRFRVSAEDAFKNKDFNKALEYYRKGLAIEPLWPQGQFNAAHLASELHQYELAALHMKHYLELVPDAANAKDAREKMYLWEEKAKEKEKMQSSSETTQEPNKPKKR